jgi:1-deoxy-D-xylulose-5-phosphate synthase
VELGKGEIVYGQPDAEIIVWAIGAMVAQSVNAAKQTGRNICVVNARFAAPLDKELLQATTKKARKLFTVEENSRRGGFGAAVAEALTELKISVPHIICGMPDNFVGQGPVEQLYQDCGLDVETLAKLFNV